MEKTTFGKNNKFLDVCKKCFFKKKYTKFFSLRARKFHFSEYNKNSEIFSEWVLKPLN